MPKPRFADAAGRPLTRGGLGRSACWISGGRTACSLADHGGVEELVHFGDQPLHRQAFFRAGFRSAYPRVFRAQVLVGDRTWTIGVGDGALHPSGWTGRMAIPELGLDLEVAILCVDDALVQAVRPLRNPRRHRIGLRLMLRDYTRIEGPRRTWTPWEAGDGAPRCLVEDLPAPERHEELNAGQVKPSYPDDEDPRVTGIAVVGDGPVSMTCFRSQLRRFDVAPTGSGAVAQAVVFAPSAADLGGRIAAWSGRVSEEAWAAVAAWSRAERLAPRVAGLDPEPASFAAQVPGLLRAAMPADLPGGMRASYNSYWIWGWDTLVHAHAVLINGLGGTMADALDLYARTAHPDHGIGHCFDARMRLRATQQLPAQGLFAVAAWQLWAVDGDDGPARRHWPFIAAWLDRCAAVPRREGLAVGMALIPDFPQDAGQDGDDLTSFNNSILHQACRCVAQLAARFGDRRTGDLAAGLADGCREGFRRVLWDAEAGFWSDSVRASTLERRPSFPAHPILWVTPFARELVHDAERAAAFMERHHRCAGGLRMYPHDDPCFNGDGNQLGQHYVCGQDPVYVHLMAATGRQERLREWLGWMSLHWGNLTVPEGTTVEAENDGPHRPDLPGARQMFSVKGWSNALLGGVLGISCDPDGLTIGPGLDADQVWRGLHLHGRRWTIRTAGRGPHVASVEVAGRRWTGTAKVPLPERGRAVITVRRTATPPRHPLLRSADGATVVDSRTGTGSLDLAVHPRIATCLRLWSPSRPRIRIDGHARPASWDRRTGEAECWLAPAERPVQVDIRCS